MLIQKIVLSISVMSFQYGVVCQTLIVVRRFGGGEIGFQSHL